MLTSKPVRLAVAPTKDPSARKSRPSDSGGIATASSGAARSTGAGKVLLLGPRPSRVGAVVRIGVALHGRLDLGDRLRGAFAPDIGDQTWRAAEPEGVG